MSKNLYKAKRTDNGEWVVGFLFYQIWDSVKICCIGCEPLQGSYCGDIVGCWFEVNEETVCQCVGMTDKDGRNIFEGDIISLLNTCSPCKAKVEYGNCEYVLSGINRLVRVPLYGYRQNDIEVIGNIHDKEWKQ